MKWFFEPDTRYAHNTRAWYKVMVCAVHNRQVTPHGVELAVVDCLSPDGLTGRYVIKTNVVVASSNWSRVDP